MISLNEPRGFEDVDLRAGGDVEVSVGVDGERPGGGEGAGQFVARDVGFGRGEVGSCTGAVDANDGRSLGDVEVTVGGAARVVGGDAQVAAAAAEAGVQVGARVGGIGWGEAPEVICV